MAALGELYIERFKHIGFIQEAMTKARHEGFNDAIKEILESGNVHSYQKDWLRSLIKTEKKERELKEPTITTPNTTKEKHSASQEGE